MTFLADVNLLVDLAIDRQPFSADAKRLFDVVAARRLPVFVAASALPTLFYVVERLTDTPTAFAALDRTLAGADILEVTRSTIVAARGMPGRDFEDNIHIACAVAAGAEAIITRNPSDFTASPVRVMSPTELLATLETGST